MGRFDSPTIKGNTPHRMLSLEEAVERSIAAAPLLGSEIVPLADAGGRFVVSALKAGMSLPGFDNSAMDAVSYTHLTLPTKRIV